MNISSMTGFARTDGTADGLTWTWEARSVNGRGLDVRLRLPPGNEALEIPARDAVAKRFSRGNIALALAIEKQQTNGAIRLNETVLADVIKVVDRISTLCGAARPDAAQLLMIKGVLETADQGPEDAEARTKRERALIESLEATLEKLSEARRAEGARLADVIKDQLAQIERYAADVEPRRRGRRRRSWPASRTTSRGCSIRRRPWMATGCIRKRCCSQPAPMSKKSCKGLRLTLAQRVTF